MTRSSVVVNTYNTVDIEGILELYDSIPFVSSVFARNNNLLKHFILHPHVGKDGIYIVKESGKIVGLAIVAIIDLEEITEGQILEFQVKDFSLLKPLIQAVLDYCISKDVDMITIAPAVPMDNGEVFKDWLPFEREKIMCKALCLLPLLKSLIDNERVKNLYAGKKIIFALGEITIMVKIEPGSVEAIQIEHPLDKLIPVVKMQTRRWIRNLPVIRSK